MSSPNNYIICYNSQRGCTGFDLETKL